MRRSSVWMIAVLSAALASSVYSQAPENKEAQAAAEFKGMPPRASPTEYQAQAKAGAFTVAAEFAGHSVPKVEGPLNTEEFVVVETAFFGAPGSRLVLSTNDFSLRINGKKGKLDSVPFGMVTSSLKDPEWQPPEQKDEQKPSKGGLSTGQGGDSTPVVVHVPLELRRAMAQYLQKASLPEGDRQLPAAGLIYFRFSGRVKSIRSIELVYNGPAGEATLALQP